MAVLATALAGIQTKAQNCYDPNYVPGCVNTTQAVCQPTVACTTPTDATPVANNDLDCYPRRSSSVVYIGSPEARARNSYSRWNRPCNSSTQVIHFGRIQGCQQGYDFGRQR